MKRWAGRKNSLYFQFVGLLTVSMAGALLFFFVLGSISDYLIDNYYHTSNYVEFREKRYMDDLQDYVTEQGVGLRDSEQITAWLRQKKMLRMQVYEKNILVYDSMYKDMEELWKENILLDFDEGDLYYEIQFADGVGDVSIRGPYQYQLYNYAMYMELFLSFLVFLALVTFGIRRKMAYIRRLSEEVEILEGGNLDYPITVQGRDELTELARGLDCMRQSFRDQAEQEARMTQENHRIVTEMSHDLRTPLTSILLYTEILRKGACRNEQQLSDYLEKIERKANCLKQLSDHLFEHAIVTGETEIALEEPESYETVFYDLFSETCSYLEQKGFQVRTAAQWGKGKIQVDNGYISRILDNITANIVKYADESRPVIIGCRSDEKEVCLFFENVVRSCGGKEESTGIGLQNVKNMMMKMDGSSRVTRENGRFQIEIIFPMIQE